MEKAKSFLKKKITIYGIVIVVLVVVGFFIFKNNNPTVETMTISHGTFLNQASVSGKVVPASSVDLGFKVGGRISHTYFSVGQKVRKDQPLASLDSKDVEGSLQVAKANYEKILNGATGEDINVAKAGVETAQTALDQAKLQQQTIVSNAKKNLLNSGFIATTSDQLIQSGNQNPPIVSGTYLKDKEGQIIITEYNSSGGTSFTTTGLIQTSGMINTQVPQALGDTGLYVKFPNIINDQTKWVINIPNTESPLYLANLNAYQSSLTTQTQVLANAQAGLDQAKSALLLKQSSARVEDVASARGALLIAQSNYDNDFIYAPVDGVVSVVNIQKGEIAVANQKAVGIIVKQITN